MARSLTVRPFAVRASIVFRGRCNKSAINHFVRKQILTRPPPPEEARRILEKIEFHYKRGGPAPAPQWIQVRSTWPGREYGIQKAGVAWLRAVARSGRTPREGTAVNCDLVELMVDAADLAIGVYQATLRLWTWQGANAPEVQVLLKVE